jgi:hypothetical protein
MRCLVMLFENLRKLYDNMKKSTLYALIQGASIGVVVLTLGYNPLQWEWWALIISLNVALVCSSLHNADVDTRRADARTQQGG